MSLERMLPANCVMTVGSKRPLEMSCANALNGLPCCPVAFAACAILTAIAAFCACWYWICASVGPLEAGWEDAAVGKTGLISGGAGTGGGGEAVLLTGIPVKYTSESGGSVNHASSGPSGLLAWHMLRSFSAVDPSRPNGAVVDLPPSGEPRITHEQATSLLRHRSPMLSQSTSSYAAELSSRTHWFIPRVSASIAARLALSVNTTRYCFLGSCAWDRCGA